MKLIQTIHAYDVSMFYWVMQRKSQKLLVRCARFVSHSADGHLYLALAGFLAWSRTYPNQQLLACMALALLLQPGLAVLLFYCTSALISLVSRVLHYRIQTPRARQV